MDTPRSPTSSATFGVAIADAVVADRLRSYLAHSGWSEQDSDHGPSLVVADAGLELGSQARGTLFVVRVGPPSPKLIEKALREEARDYWATPLEADLITLRARALRDQLEREESLREKEQQFHSMVLNNPGVVYRCRFDEGWTMEFISQRVETLMGYPPEDFVLRGRTYASIMAPEDQQRIADDVQKALDDDRPFSLEYRVQRADGEWIWVNSRGRGIRGGDGALRYLDGAIFDITSEREANIQLTRSAAQLHEKNEELRRLDAAKTRMFQNVSHELRTPLSLILAPVERLASTASDPERRGTLESVRSNSLRLLDQINGILDLARMDVRGVTVRPQTIDVPNYVRRLASDVAPAAEEREIEFRVEAGTGPCLVSLDPTHLERILLNLVANALKFTPSGGVVTLSTRADGSRVSFEVRDSGCGIPTEAQTRIFERFGQVEVDADQAPSGTGIGLSMVQELTARMGGQLALQSEPSVGSAFTVTFDAVVAGAGDEENVAVAPPSEGSSALASFDRQAQLEALRVKRRAGGVVRGGERGPLVLVAEDEPELALEIVRCLSARFRVVAVPDGLAALEALQHDAPAAVVSDVGMPRMDGIELCQRLRERADFHDVGIVLLSAHADVSDRIRGRRTGADAYMTKPFHPEELLAAVEGILRSRLRMVGDFEVHERLGRGGQGTVFLAESTVSGEFAALKLLSGGVAGDTSRRDALRAELAILQTLDHPNIVRVLDQGADDEMTYLVMEYIDGASLHEVLDSVGALPDSQIRTIVLGILEAMAYLHDQGLVHRDLKPSNVLLLRQGPRTPAAIKLIDFGVAQGILDEVSDSGTVTGTLAFLAPEQLDGSSTDSSMKSDVFALGVIGYLLATGELPRTGGENSVSEAALKALGRTTHATWITAALSSDPTTRIDVTGVLSIVRGLAGEDLPALPERRGVAKELGETV